MNLSNLKKIIALSLKEDIGFGDITTSSLVDARAKIQADIIVKSEGVVAGLIVAKEVFRQVNPRLTFRPLAKDGQRVKANTTIAHVYGAAASILTAERVALNMLSMLSGIATKTQSFVSLIKPYKTQILDTRKTAPMLRELQRYAVRCGGGFNHRFDLSTMAMIKDNHRLLAVGKMTLIEAVEVIKKKHPHKIVELEVDHVDELKEALKSKAEIILLDNMTPAQIKNAIKLRHQSKSKVLLEASGGINLKNIKSYAATGVDRISVGALTHTIEALDISLDIAYHA